MSRSGRLGCSRLSALELHLTEPAGVGAPVVLRQPGVNPLVVSVEDQHC
jgi:hypothetical protein